MKNAKQRKAEEADLRMLRDAKHTGTALVEDEADMLDAVSTTEHNLSAAHAALAKGTELLQRSLNRTRRVRQALQHHQPLEKPHYPIREVRPGDEGDVYHEPRELYDDLEEPAIFIDARGKRFRLVLLPHFELAE